MTAKLSNLEGISDFNQNFLTAVPWLKPDWSGLERERAGREEQSLQAHKLLGGVWV